MAADILERSSMWTTIRRLTMLLLAALFIGVSASFVVIWLKSNQELQQEPGQPQTQQEAIMEILACGGRALVRGEGDKLQVIAVSFHDSKITDDQIGCLAHLEDLRILDLSQTPITNNGLSRLEGLIHTDLLKLRLVSVADTRISRQPYFPPNVRTTEHQIAADWYFTFDKDVAQAAKGATWVSPREPE